MYRFPSFLLVIIALVISVEECEASTLQAPPSMQLERSLILAKKPRRERLPKYFAQLKLTESQRKRISDIQAKHRAERAKLQERMKALDGRLEKDLNKVLNRQQRRQLKQLSEPANSTAAT